MFLSTVSVGSCLIPSSVHLPCPAPSASLCISLWSLGIPAQVFLADPEQAELTQDTPPWPVVVKEPPWQHPLVPGMMEIYAPSLICPYSLWPTVQVFCSPGGRCERWGFEAGGCVGVAWGVERGCRQGMVSQEALIQEAGEPG